MKVHAVTISIATLVSSLCLLPISRVLSSPIPNASPDSPDQSLHRAREGVLDTRAPPTSWLSGLSNEQAIKGVAPVTEETGSIAAAESSTLAEHLPLSSELPSRTQPDASHPHSLIHPDAMYRQKIGAAAQSDFADAEAASTLWLLAHSHSASGHKSPAIKPSASTRPSHLYAVSARPGVSISPLATSHHAEQVKQIASSSSQPAEINPYPGRKYKSLEEANEARLAKMRERYRNRAKPDGKVRRYVKRLRTWEGQTKQEKDDERLRSRLASQEENNARRFGDLGSRERLLHSAHMKTWMQKKRSKSRNLSVSGQETDEWLSEDSGSIGSKTS